MPDADITVSVTCPATLKAGQNGTCTITVGNNGPGQATLVITAATLPAALTERSCTGGCIVTGSTVAWEPLATLGAHATRRYTITVHATGAAGRVQLLAAAQAANPDPIPGNNAAITTINLVKA